MHEPWQYEHEQELLMNGLVTPDVKHGDDVIPGSLSAYWGQFWKQFLVNEKEWHYANAN